MLNFVDHLSVISWMVSDARFGDKPSLHMWEQSQVKPVGWMVTWIPRSPICQKDQMSRSFLVWKLNYSQAAPSRHPKTPAILPVRKVGTVALAVLHAASRNCARHRRTWQIATLSLNMLNHYHQSCASMFNLDVSETHPLQGWNMLKCFSWNDEQYCDILRCCRLHSRFWSINSWFDFVDLNIVTNPFVVNVWSMFGQLGIARELCYRTFAMLRDFHIQKQPSYHMVVTNCWNKGLRTWVALSWWKHRKPYTCDSSLFGHLLDWLVESGCWRLL